MTSLQPIVQEIAAREGVSATELPPINESVDLGTVNDVIEAPRESDAAVEFDYAGYHVSIVAEGDVTIEKKQNEL